MKANFLIACVISVLGIQPLGACAQGIDLTCTESGSHYLVIAEKGQAAAQPLQININYPAAGGAIAIPRNGAIICNMVANGSDYSFTSGTARIEFMPAGSWSDGNPNNPHLIDQTITTSASVTGPHTAQFVLRQNNAPLKGNVTVILWVNYR